MNKNKFPKNFNFIDLFAGIGGFRIALEHYGGKCVFSSDWDKQSQIVYKENFGEEPFGDITKIREHDIPPHNIICGGFPCQAFSISGKRRGFEDTRGTLFFDVARIAKYHKPEILFLENVKNFARHDNGKTLQTVCDALTKIGYDVYHQILNASLYGAPTSRERIYIVAFKKNLKIKKFKFPKPTFEQIHLEDILEPKNKTAKYKIERKDIKFYSKTPKFKKDIFGNYPLSPIQIGQINKGGQGERIYSPKGHAITLSAYGGGAAGKTGAYHINGIVRRLSPRECARVMGFPESYKIPVSDIQAYKLFGNSVVVPVLKNIFKKIINALQ